MAFWDSKAQKIKYRKPIPFPGYPKWLEIDCGCCNGLQWGGYEPRECNICEGAGRYAKHVLSGVLAEYPGGPFLGRDQNGG